MADSIIQIKSLPGVKRDGTRLEGDAYVDGQWVRFQRGLPRKIGGYRAINKYLREISRALSEFTQDGLTYVHSGSANYVERFYIDASNNTSVISDRTPASGFTADPDNMWQFAIDGKLAGGVYGNLLIAQVAPNLGDLCNSVGGGLYSGDLLATAALTPISLATGASATGGVVALHPYTFVFGNNGYVGWSVAGNPTDFTNTGSGAVQVAAQKIVAALPLRGGPGNSPSGLFWAADALVRASFIGGAPVFQFDTLSTQTSIMSSRCPIEYDGVFYWIGVDRFLMFNGVVREVPNDMNQNFFFDNLNYDQRQKVFAFKVPRFGEIWWCFPKGTSTEPNHAIIYNVRENSWYDTELPNAGRSAGLFPTVFRKPLLTGVEAQPFTALSAVVTAGGAGYVVGDALTAVGGLGAVAARFAVAAQTAGAVTAVTVAEAGSYTVTPTNPVAVTGGSGSGATLTVTFSQPYKLWIHEEGTDEIDGQRTQPIRSYFETSDISLPVQQGLNKAIHISMMEPDFVQSGDMTVQAMGRANARAPEVNGDPLTFTEIAELTEQQVTHFKAQRRELRFRFESNTLGGDYQMGTVLAHVSEGDGRSVS